MARPPGQRGPGWFGRRLVSYLRIAVSDPAGFLRRVRARQAHLLLATVTSIPRGIRRPIARPIARATEAAAGRRPDRSWLPVLAFVTAYAAGPPERADGVARRFGTSGETAPGARRRLAQLSLDNGLRPAAAAIVESMPGDTTPNVEVLRARFAFDAGRYEDALDHALRADRGGVTSTILDQVRSRLTSLQPGWTPDLGPGRNRLGKARRTVPGRILHLASSSLPYRQVGYTVRLQAVAQAQIGAGLDPQVATRAGFPRVDGVLDAPKEEELDGVTYHHLAPDFGDNGYHDRVITESARAAVPLVERLRPAVLQPASNHIQAQIGLTLGQAAGIPVVYEVRGFLEETWLSRPGQVEETALELDHYRLNRDAETRAILAADAVVTLSETMRDDIVARGADAERVVIVPNAVDVERFVPVPRDEALATELGIGPSQLVVGYISSFSRYEGIPILLEAAAQLRAAAVPIRLLLVGTGDDLATIRTTAERLGLADGTLLMPGRVPHADVARYYSLIDAFVVPRTPHRVSRLVTPLKPYEAMAMERAVVVSDLPALREVVDPGETGLTFRAGDSGDLANVLGALLDDPEQRARLGRQAREWIVSERTWARNGQRYRELFERLGVA